LDKTSQPTGPSPFAIPLYRRVWFASVGSQFGGLIQSVGAAWMMVQMNGSKTQIALVQASVTLPIMILALLSGAIADNVPRRTVMLVAQIYMFTVSVLLCVFAWLGLLSPWLLLMFTFLIGCGTAINAPSWQATVGDIVPRTTIPAAVSMNSMGFNIARTAGPAIGGMIVAAFGAAAAFTLNVFSYLGLIYVLLTWRPNEHERPSLREDLRTAMAAGVRYVSLSPPISRVMMRAAVFGIAASAVPSLLPLVAHQLLGGNAVTFGLLSGAFGAGAVLGALSSRRIRDRFSNEMTIRITVVAMIAGAVIVAESRWLALTMGGLVVFGAAWLVTMAMMNVAVQMSAPRWVLGRALSLYQMSIFGAMAAGSWISGSLSEQFGVADALLIMAAVQSVGLLAGLFFPLPEIGDLNLDLVGRWRVPDVKVAIEPRAGPVHVSVQYRIQERDIPSLLTAMNHRRRFLRRDGAMDWSLLRDLSDPEVWIEKYRFPRWLDYVLHNQRRTMSDDAEMGTLRALHQGTWPPPVQRMLQRQVNTASLNSNLAADTTNDPT
jgi:MFS family permease